MLIKKLIYTTLFLFIIFPVSAQKDTEHWFAPIAYPLPKTDEECVGNKSTPNYNALYDSFATNYSLYVSTPETTPFDVEIYNGDDLIKTLTISKGNSQKVTLPFDLLFAGLHSNLGMFGITKKGLHVIGSKKFYANIRIQSNFLSEIINSKGKAALGKNFNIAYPPLLRDIDGENYNFVVGIIATQDNTNIRISNYNNNVIFYDGLKRQSINITLNKGESYVIAAEANLSTNNKDGMIGANITSDKPISVTNGAFTGQYATSAYYVCNKQDILMDQSVPVERLGEEYLIMKGIGRLSTNMERALIIATKDNTKVYFNDENNPTITLNAGEYYLMPENKYIKQGNIQYTHYYGALIKTSQKSYVYQLGSGTFNTSSSFDSGYMLLASPLNCYVDKEIDEFSEIGNMPYNIFFEDRSKTQLNIFTKKNASITLNNKPIPSQFGPFNMVGNTNWDVYVLSNVLGNISINSQEAVMASFSSGEDSYGEGAYITGSYTIPAIEVIGNCLPNVKLQIENNYDNYQWYLNDTIIPNANLNYYIPTLPGEYTVGVSKNGCNELKTESVKIVMCNIKSETYTGCSGQIITPSFSPPNQNLTISNLTVFDYPIFGQTKIENNKIYYNASNGFYGNDKLIYKICSNNNFCEYKEVKISVSTPSLAELKKEINSIDTADNINFVYDLNESVIDLKSEQINFYKNIQDAQNSTNVIQNISLFFSTENEVYAKTTNSNNCILIHKINLNKKFKILDKENFLPNSFTPNNDGTNDVWSFEKIKDYKNVQVNVFDRFGNLVYKYINGQPFSWNGKDTQNRKVPTGNYWAFISGDNTEKNETLKKTMWVYLKNRD